MPIDSEGIFFPDLFDRQLEVYNCMKRAMLVCGPRLSGKTIAVLHKIVRHLWEVKGARVAMFSRTLKNSKDGGPWMKMQRDILPEWFKSGIGIRYTTMGADKRPGPKVDGQTRTPFFRVRNGYGGESECMLFSLDVDNDVEDKLKEMEFSLIYFSELSKFGTRGVLQYGLPALRMLNIPFEQQQWIADTNPAEEGESSWIYRAFYLERKWTYDEYTAHNTEVGLPVLPERVFDFFKTNSDVLEWGIRENPRLDPRQIDEVTVACGSDIGMYERLVNGKWVFGFGDQSRHFRGCFRENLHVVGNCSSQNEDDWEYLNPSPTIAELITGWDLGDKNHAAVAIERNVISGRSYFSVLDELVNIGKEMSVEEFTVAFMGLIEGNPDMPEGRLSIEEIAGHRLDLERAWSDRSSIEKYQSTGDTYQHLEVYAASRNRIQLIGVPKAKHSVAQRVRLLKKLLMQGRIRVSAHCTMTIQMLRDLKKGKGALNYVVDDENKHVFDALTYALLMECAEELQTLDPETVGRRDRPAFATSIS